MWRVGGGKGAERDAEVGMDGEEKVDLFGALLPGEKGSSRSWEGGRPPEEGHRQDKPGG